jgi:UDP-N-acetylmuramoyl-tripeptide--D-alanyl-D-alanine ligase
LTDVRGGLESLQPVAGRLQGRTGTAGIRLIDDSYNANPASLQAALEVLAEHPGERVLVLGDMAELGASAEQMHEEAGRAARRAGVHRLYALGTLSQRAVRTFGAAACHFEDRDSLVQALRPTLTPATCVLVKSSRAMRMEGVVDALSESSGG